MERGEKGGILPDVLVAGHLHGLIALLARDLQQENVQQASLPKGESRPPKHVT